MTSAVKTPLPVGLEWLEAKVESLVRPRAILRDAGPLDAALPPGGTALGHVDLPADAEWVKRLDEMRPRSCHDGEAVWLQLNLAEVPGVVRAQYEGLPPQGMVWVTLDLAGAWWKANAYFDPRAASTIPFLTREVAGRRASRFEISDSMTMVTKEAIPELAWSFDRRGVIDPDVAEFDAWVSKNYPDAGDLLQVGGWILPIQGEPEKTLLAALERQPFGDYGALYLHFESSKGFWAEVHSH